MFWNYGIAECGILALNNINEKKIILEVVRNLDAYVLVLFHNTAIYHLR